MAGTKTQKKKGERFRVTLGPLSIFLWGIFILFFMGWIFVLGIFVGRGYVPDTLTDISGIKGEITIKKPIETEKKESAAGGSSADAGTTEPELVFYDRLTSKKDEAKNNTHTEEAASKRTVSPAPAPAAASGNDRVKSSGSSTVKTGAGKYTIQVDALSDLASAEKRVKELLEKGFDAYYYETTVKGKKYYRIRCGRFSDKAEAATYSLRLEEKIGIKGYVTDVE